MTDEPLVLIQEANQFLDEIDERRTHDEKNIPTLEQLRSQMILLGFNAPFSALLSQAKAELDEADASELADQRKQARQIRYIASLKKSVLNRVRVALAAHRLRPALEAAGLSNFASRLPFGGSHLALLSQGGDYAADAYRKLMMLFERRSFSMAGATVTVKFMQDGQISERTLSLDAGADAKAAVQKLFGPGIEVADVIIILGFFSIFQWEFSLTVLAAVLAILGYSVNESVVVADRIRENFRKMRKASVTQIIDNAITRTMSRTIITHGCTQAAVLAMLLFGGAALHYFAVALTIGILFGIYSSVLVMAPIVRWLGVRREDLVKPVKDRREEAVV